MIMAARANWLRVTLLVVCWAAADAGEAQVPERSPATRSLVADFCLDCHSQQDPASGLDLESILMANVPENSESWERVVRKLRARQMPPLQSRRPDEKTYATAVNSLTSVLDRAAANRPVPGRTQTFRRLNRTEYRNAIRDLLSLDVDVTELLPEDSASHGFDNVTVGDLTPTLLNRYISAAQWISQLAIGRPYSTPRADTFRIRPDLTQDERIPGLPVGTRGGAVIRYEFPQNGEYEIQIRLARDRNEHVEGLREAHELELLLDLQRVGRFIVKPPRGVRPADDYAQPSHAKVDQHLKARIKVTAGPHQLGVTFLKNPSSLLETARQPLNVHFNVYRHPRIGPAIYQISITGPFDAVGPGDTPSRRRVFVCRPTRASGGEPSAEEEERCAVRILTTLMRRAYRRPVVQADLERPLALYRESRERGGFEAGVEMALSAVLVNPQFLFRIERDPQGVTSNSVYRISDLELASRLSFFLWSSIPDDELLDLAIGRQLVKPRVLQQQVRRMLADPRASSLVTNFAGQWLHLRNLKSTAPDMRRFPDFDDNLRQALQRETELFFENIIHEDRSVLDLLKADYTYLNERLAKHYGIPHVHGSRFRRVKLEPGSERGGLLRHGSLLTVTSYATRTSPVLRGKWILENILGTPPPPPPPDVPVLPASTVASTASVRERLATHRASPVCARCHDLIDPIGFSLESFDAVGRWRSLERGRAIDNTGSLPDGRQFRGVAGLEQGLLARPELFVGTMVEKLLTFALGRGVEHFDAPAIRGIVRQAAKEDYQFSSLVLGIVSSPAFQLRTSS